MFLESWIPTLSTSLTETIVYVVALLGALLLAYGVFLETERRQDLVFFLGASCLLIYALYISNIIFVIAMGTFALNALIEFIEIVVGLHKHNPEELKRIKKMK